VPELRLQPSVLACAGVNDDDKLCVEFNTLVAIRDYGLAVMQQPRQACLKPMREPPEIFDVCRPAERLVQSTLTCDWLRQPAIVPAAVV
jgi:hypothetical protein